MEKILAINITEDADVKLYLFDHPKPDLVTALEGINGLNTLSDSLEGDQEEQLDFVMDTIQKLQNKLTTPFEPLTVEQCLTCKPDKIVIFWY